MGGRLSCQLTSREHRYISEHIADIMEKLDPLFRQHYCSNLLIHLRDKHIGPNEPRPLIQHPDAVARAGVILEGALPQYLDGRWTLRHLQVTGGFTVESRDAKEVFERGWGCKTELALSGCKICTSVREHQELVDDMYRNITGGKLACWDCPTAFPVFIQHPYSGPVCVATASYQEQTQWANILRAAAQHQSSALWCEGSLVSRAFLDAVSSLKKLRANCRTMMLPMGNEEEVIAGMLMEEIMFYLRQQVFPKIIVHHSRKRKAWIKLVSKVYKTARHQVKVALVTMKKELWLYCSEVEKQMSAGLKQASELRDHIAHTITEDTCEPMLQCLLRAIILRLDRTLQEVATPVCDAVASTWQYFLESCDEITDHGYKSTSEKNTKKQVLIPLGGLGPHDARLRQCLDRLKLSSAGCEWLQETWGVHTESWRPLTLKAQNALYNVVDACTVMFWRLVSRYASFSADSSQLTTVLCKVKDRVVKHLENKLLALRSQLILEMMLHITLPAFTEGVGAQNLSCYKAMVSSEQALFIHPDIIFNTVLRDNLTSYIQSVMRYSLPQQFVPLPVDSSSGFSERHQLLPPGDCQQNLCQISESPVSDSKTLTLSPVTDRGDTLQNETHHMPA